MINCHGNNFDRDKLSRNEQWNSHFWRSVQNIVEKDVVRTDRTHVYYKGEGNANVDVLKEILLNYAVQHPHLGYTQVKHYFMFCVAIMIKIMVGQVVIH